MQTQEKMTLGQALAHLRAQKFSDSYKNDSLSEQNINYIDSLRTRVEYLEKSGKREEISNIINNPQPEIQIGQLDFFLHLFLCDETDNECVKIAKTLNNNFKWFEEFSMVLNDFILRYNILTNKGNL